MSKNFRFYSVLAVILMCIAALIGVYVVLGVTQNHGHIGNSYFDFNGSYGIKIQPVDSQGSNAFSFPNVPWTLLFDKVLFFSFLPKDLAQICFSVMIWAVYIMTALIVYGFMKECIPGDILKLILLLPLAQFSFMYSLWWGNKGGILCLLLIDAIIIIRRHPYIAGFLLALGMTKPQIGGLICLMFLLRGHYKALITGAVIDLAVWFITSLMMNTTMLELLRLCLNASVYRETQYLGVMAMLQYYGISKNAAVIMSVLIGIIYMLMIYVYFRKNIHSSKVLEFMAYIPACIASIVWMYKNGCDFLVLAYPAAFAVIMCMWQEISRKDFFILLVIIAVLMLSRCMVYFGIVIIDKSDFFRDAYKTFESVLLMISGGIFCRMCVKNQGAFDL